MDENNKGSEAGNGPLKPIFDPARLYHVAICVKSVADTARFYEQQFGIGPFVFRDVNFTDATYYGEKAGYTGKRGFAMMGPMMLELIETTSGKTIQEDFLNEKGEGLHHLGFEVDSLADSIAAAESRGFRVTQAFHRPDGSGFAYFDTDAVGGTVFEVVEKPVKFF